MSSAARGFATSLDLLDPALHASGVALVELRRLCDVAPVAWCPGRRGPGYWSITGHAELVEAARDAATFSSYWGTRPEVSRPPHAARPLHNLDPPEHGALRAIAARAVSVERLDALAPALEAIVESTLAGLAGRGGGDLVRELAEPIPARVFAAWLGLPAARAPELLWHVLAVHQAGAALLDARGDDPDRAARVTAARDATERIAGFLRDALGAAEPASVLGELATAAPAQAVGLATLFVEAGLPTLIDALASSLVDLLEHGLLEHGLLEHGSPGSDAANARSMPALVEELLRRASPIAQFARRARRDTLLGGQRIAAGEQLVLWFVAANHDPRVFAEPDQLIATRAPNPHVAFGIGPHRCIGAAFGRLLLRTVLRAWSTLRVELDGAAVRRPSSYLRGYTTVPVIVSR